MKRIVFITGGTGTLGRELVRRYLRDEPSVELRILIRGASRSEARAKWDALSSGLSGISDLRGVEPVCGDLTSRERMGIERAAYGVLCREVTDILHCAASTRFDLSLDRAREINVGGCESLLDFSRDCGRLDRIGCA